MAKPFIISTTDEDLVEKQIKNFKLNLGIEEKNFVDFLEIQPEKTKSIGVKQIKLLKNWAISKPHNSENKLGVIKKSELLTIEAQNSLLKILEEPNESTTFLLFTSSYRKLLKTIQSRCEKVQLSSHEADQEASSDLIGLSLAESLSRVDSLLKIKDTTVKSQKISEFIENYLQAYRQKLLINPSEKKYRKHIDYILTANKQIKANVPPKTALTTLIILLEEAG